MPSVRPSSASTSRRVPFAVAAALLVAVVVAPSSRPDPLATGARVRYSEDRVGYAWSVVGPQEFGRYLIRPRSPGGDNLCVAEADELAPLPPGGHAPRL